MLTTTTRTSLWALDVRRPYPHPVPVPRLGGFTTIHGVKVASLGEDGHMVALGHVGKLRALAAFNGYSRLVYGFRATRNHNRPSGTESGPAPALNDGWWCPGEELDHVTHEWCTNDADPDEWIMRRALPTDEGAFPVTVWSP